MNIFLNSLTHFTIPKVTGEVNVKSYLIFVNPLETINCLSRQQTSVFWMSFTFSVHL